MNSLTALSLCVDCIQFCFCPCFVATSSCFLVQLESGLHLVCVCNSQSCCPLLGKTLVSDTVKMYLDCLWLNKISAKWKPWKTSLVATFRLWNFWLNPLPHLKTEQPRTVQSVVLTCWRYWFHSPCQLIFVSDSLPSQITNSLWKCS